MALTPKAAHGKDLTAGIGPMEHRHFATIATIATIIREMEQGVIPCSTDATRKFIALQFADRLAQSNPRFDRDRFLRACAG